MGSSGILRTANNLTASHFFGGRDSEKTVRDRCGNLRSLGGAGLVFRFNFPDILREGSRRFELHKSPGSGSGASESMKVS